MQKRRKRQARYGIATEPHILVEIEDIEAKLTKLQKELTDPEQVSRNNLYRGLSAFREIDTDIFFGREVFTSQLRKGTGVVEWE